MLSSAPRRGLRALVGQPAFAVEGTVYFWEDAVLAARAWGDWAALEAEAREGVACARHLLAAGDSPTEEEEDAAATEFRVARDLLTAAQTEAWLRERGLGVASWQEHVRRALLRRKWAASLADLVARYPATDAQLRRALAAAGVCSGHLARFADKLAGRAAVHARLRGEPDGATAAVASDGGAGELLGLAPEVCRAKLEALARLERSFERFCRQVVTAEAVRRQVSARYTDWIRVRYCWAGFPEEAMAREAALCVREDGEALADVAARAGVSVGRGQLYLEQVYPDLHDAFLSAREGELLGPVACGGEFRLFAVLEKVPPRETDPDVRRRAEQALVQGAVAREVESRVVWHKRL
jgi:hypothetical protein